MQSEFGTLYIIPTPIGNLKDITQRALETLQSVDLVLAEDTRHSGLLLTHYGIKQNFIALHDHNEQQKAQLVLNKLQQGLNIALISDAGTPLISDPGFHVVKACREARIKVVPLAGACALITALSASGIASDRFCFEGFLPAKPKAREDRLKELVHEERTLIFYESTHRIEETISHLCQIFGAERYVIIARELTKTWESIHGDTLANLVPWLKADPNRIKGEIVLVVEGFKATTSTEEISSQVQEALKLLSVELPLKKACQITAKLFQLKKNALYQWALENLNQE